MSLVLATLLEELAAGRLRVVDLTQPLSPQTPLLPLPTQWNNTPAFKIWELSRYDERGPAWYWNGFETGEHTGTHFDAPVHWVSGKDLPDNTVDRIPPKKFVGPACVIDISVERWQESRLFADAGAYPPVGGDSTAVFRRAHGFCCVRTGRSGRTRRTTST